MGVSLERYTWASDLAPDDLAAVTRLHNAVWADWITGERPISEAAYVDMDRFSAPPERMERLIARDADAGVVGHGLVFWRDGPGGCTLRTFVDSGHRRCGVGTALGRELARLALEAGRDSVATEVAPGSAAHAIVSRTPGFTADLVVELNRTHTRGIDGALLDRWQAAGEEAAGYSLVAYDDRCPDEGLATDFVRARAVMNDAPRGQGEAEATYTVDELRAVEEASAAANQRWWNVGVRHDDSGELVGLSEMFLPDRRPWIAFQGDTGVRPDHRGHGLGAWMKAVNHLRLADERPDVEVVQTWNAERNEPMLRINRALGFRSLQRFEHWYRPLP